jgi:hypothetical protein
MVKGYVRGDNPGNFPLYFIFRVCIPEIREIAYETGNPVLFHVRPRPPDGRSHCRRCPRSSGCRSSSAPGSGDPAGRSAGKVIFIIRSGYFEAGPGGIPDHQVHCLCIQSDVLRGYVWYSHREVTGFTKKHWPFMHCITENSGSAQKSRSGPGRTFPGLTLPVLPRSAGRLPKTRTLPTGTPSNPTPLPLSRMARLS